ncbi:formylglycine-generating enzyme family protein [Streptomyces sp. NPDC048560]|uniref:formylglycine-generating enzyme family protein n=1 Tax=Streptomyces sp. NPDC048560 TaxID=3155488 RepID=UPI00343AE450
MSQHGMTLVPGGAFRMGSAAFYPEEGPVITAEVDSLWVDDHPVTNDAFRRFVADTGHVTVAETAPDPHDFPGADPSLLVPGSQVFTPTARPVPLHDWTQWWRWVPGASWRHPEGPGSTVHGLDLHPVVHIGLEDGQAYAAWAGKRLPTEAEWEHAARGGLDGATYAWGEDFMPNGQIMANTWHGDFPCRNTAPHGHTRTSPVRKFPPNGYGLYDMTGNVWELTATRWAPNHSAQTPGPVPRDAAPACCTPRTTLSEHDRFIIKGGSHLCAPSYCHRYRPAARQAHGPRDTTSHVGFRCVRSAD